MVAKQKKVNGDLSIAILEFVICVCRLGVQLCLPRAYPSYVLPHYRKLNCLYLVLMYQLVQRFWRYMVKPHEQLVLVSSTRYRAYTPNLSTS